MKMRLSFALPALLYLSSSFLLTNAAEAAVLPKSEDSKVDKSSIPPLRELDAKNFQDTIKTGYWYVSMLTIMNDHSPDVIPC